MTGDEVLWIIFFKLIYLTAAFGFENHKIREIFHYLSYVSGGLINNVARICTDVLDIVICDLHEQSALFLAPWFVGGGELVKQL